MSNNELLEKYIKEAQATCTPERCNNSRDGVMCPACQTDEKAALLEEAQAVLDETGLTPRELRAENERLKTERDRLKKVLRKLLHAVDTGDWYNDAITCEGKEEG